MLILAFDTSSKTASVAVLRDEEILYETVLDTGLNHSEVLLPAIEKACVHTGINIADADVLACTLGPGSFTGLRIGAATLKGLMLATGKPAVGISSLAALALNAGISSKMICSVMDAGRGQVYSACFRYPSKGRLEQITGEQVSNPSDIHYDHQEDVLFVGDGAVKYAGIIAGGKYIEKINVSLKQIRASSVGLLGRGKYLENELLDAETFAPVYLRSADADKKQKR